jgi:tetratricopeptide (TPR) repeat protein
MARNLSRVEALFLDAIDLDPNFAGAYATLAFFHARLGEEAPTLEYAEKALELDPDNSRAYGSIAHMYSVTNRQQEALAFSEQALQGSPADAGLLYIYGTALMAAGQPERGIGELERATQLAPDRQAAYRELGWARWLAGDRDGGLIAMRRYVELNPENPGPQRSVGMMEAALGNRAEGVTQVQLSERLAPRPTPVFAYAYRVVGLHDDAARVARAWAQTIGELPRGDIQSVFYHLVLDEEEQALDVLAQFIESPILSPPGYWVMANMFDDTILDKPEFAALRAELRAEVGWN